MTIGDDLQVLLGLVPIRDRAGIQRSTMAAEAARAADGNAEGQTLTRQTMVPQAPPMISLPPMGGPGATPEDAPQVAGPGGFGGPKLVPTRSDTRAVVPPVIDSSGGPSAAPTPAPRERVVAASPAAAPSPGVQRYSDILLQAHEDNKRREKMQQLFNGLGLLANGLFNRDADSSNATQRALSGGGGGGGGTDIATLKTLLDMRKEENNAVIGAERRESVIKLIMDKERKSREDAEALVDSGEYKKYLDPAYAKTREADSREQSMRQDLLEKVGPIAAELKLPAFQVRAEILAGNGQRILDMLNPKTRADIAGTQATTAKVTQDTAITGADYGRREDALKAPEETAARLSEQIGRKVHPNEVRQAAQTEASWQDFNKEQSTGRQTNILKDQYETQRVAQDIQTKDQNRKDWLVDKADPQGFADTHGISLAAAKRVTQTQESRDTFLKESQPTAGEFGKSYELHKREAEAAGRTPMTPEQWKVLSVPKSGPTPDEISMTDATKKVMDTVDKRNVEAQQIKSNLANRQIIQDTWDENNISGGYGVDKQLMLRSTMARITGKPDVDVDNTQAFFGIMNTEIAQAARLLPGPLSEKELQFIKDMKGGKELSPEGIRTLHILLDKADRMKMATYNDWWNEQSAHPTRGKLKGMELYGRVDLPPPGRFLQEEIKANPEFVSKLRANPTPAARKAFDKRFGADTADYVLSQPE